MSQKKTNLFMLLEENDSSLNENALGEFQTRLDSNKDSPYSQIPSSQMSNDNSNESTYLNSSTVPTYEEFTKKTAQDYSEVTVKKYRRSSINRYFNSTQAVEGLVTDDESVIDETTDEDADDTRALVIF
jgi:hypothetical protein